MLWLIIGYVLGKDRHAVQRSGRRIMTGAFLLIVLIMAVGMGIAVRLGAM